MHDQENQIGSPKIGQLVRLKSGSPPLGVIGVGAAGLVTVAWQTDMTLPAACFDLCGEACYA